MQATFRFSLSLSLRSYARLRSFDASRTLSYTFTHDARKYEHQLRLHFFLLFRFSSSYTGDLRSRGNNDVPFYVSSDGQPDDERDQQLIERAEKTSSGKATILLTVPVSRQVVTLSHWNPHQHHHGQSGKIEQQTRTGKVTQTRLYLYVLDRNE